MRTKGYFPGRVMRRTREWRKSLSSLLYGYTDLWYFSTLCYILTCEVHYMRLTSKFSKLISEKYLDIPSPQKVLSFHQQWKRRTIRHFLIVTGRLGEADPQPQVLLGNILRKTASFPLTICITYCHGDWKVPRGGKKKDLKFILLELRHKLPCLMGGWPWCKSDHKEEPWGFWGNISATA